MTENYDGLVNKPPIDEIYNISLVNKPSLDIYDTELAHYGVLGMHWGVRRYQNPDGSLTSAGKKRKQKIHKKEVDKLKKIEKEKIRRKKKKEKEHLATMKSRKKFLDNYYDLSPEDRKLANEYFDALEKMEKRDITHITKMDKKRKSAVDSLLTGPTLAKGAATMVGSIVGIALTTGKLQEWLASPSGVAVKKYVRKMIV